MLETSAGAPATRLKLPFFVWPLALLAGLAVAAGSLSYAPGGRLNVLGLWALWAGLPFLGALISLCFLLFGRDRPWLFRWRRHRLHWYPSRAQRWQMLWLIQAFWLWLGLGMLLGFWLLLLFTDLAFGWSSTLLVGERTPTTLLQLIASPWQNLWPAAVPDASLLEATRYLRIDPQRSAGERAGEWWPFLMASLVFYNLMPRALLAIVSYLRWRRLSKAGSSPEVFSSHRVEPEPSEQPALKNDSLSHWVDATTADWELAQGQAPQFGVAPWREDEQALDELLVHKPERLLWRVAANRSPVGEMADLVERARCGGVAEQGLLAVTDPQTQSERHLTSWRRFAQQHQLTWVSV